jgi:hypothetical protein
MNSSLSNIAKTRFITNECYVLNSDIKADKQIVIYKRKKLLGNNLKILMNLCLLSIIIARICHRKLPDLRH